MLVALSALIFVAPVHADEGMWLPEQLPERSESLKQMGLKMDVADLSTMDGKLAAIASLGHCSAAFVGEQGLLATNAHCTRAYLQHASQSVERDLVEEGFYAATKADELSAGPLARVYLLEEMQDVTGRVLKKANKRRIKDGDRYRKVDRARKEIAAECEAAESDRRCRVVSFDGGIRYQLVVEKELKDLRLVYVPSEAISMFGGETDNWMWPRHCGDFAFLRAYVGPDGESAAFSKDNTPYAAKSTFALSTQGVEAGDFVWIAGFPGATYRSRSAPEGLHAALDRYPNGIRIFTELMDVLRLHARQSKEARIKLGNAMFGLSNQRKSYQGMLKNFEASKFAESKRSERAELEAWIAADKKRKRAYQKDVAAFHAAVDEQIAASGRDRLLGLTRWAPRYLRVSRIAYRWGVEQAKEDLERRSGYQSRDKERIESSFKTMDRSYYAPADRDLAKKVFGWILSLEDDQAITPIVSWFEGQGGLEKGLDTLYASSDLSTPENRLALLEKSASQLEALSDPWMEIAVAMEKWQDAQKDKADARRGAMIRLRPRYVQALKEMRGGDFYSDANGTLRLSFGHVQGYKPQEAVTYDSHTSLAGLLAKEGSGEFTLDPGLAKVALAMSEDAQAAVPVNFLSTLDNTGGNSGSPTLNANGEMVGWVFDRNWEAVAADWVFAPELTRTIHADVRYAAWLLKEVEGADALLKELGLSSKGD